MGRIKIFSRFSLTYSLTHLLTAMVCLLPTIADACPGCKEALFDPAQLQQKLATAKGYAWSIGLFLSMPCVLIGSIVTLIVRARGRRQR